MGFDRLMAEVSIRKAQHADAAAVRHVIRAAYAPWVGQLPDLPDVSAGVFDDIAAGHVHLAEQDQTVIGCLIGRATDANFHLANIAVAPDHGGKGVGRDLMRFAETLARALGCREMHLATHRKMSANVAFYQRLGWTVSGAVGNKVTMMLALDR